MFKPTKKEEAEKSGYESLLERGSRSSSESDPVDGFQDPREQAFRPSERPYSKFFAFLRRPSTIITTLCLVASITSLVIAGKFYKDSNVVHNHHHLHNSGPLKLIKGPDGAEFISCSCGSSSAEALALGCKFDGIAAAFLPPHCRDDELLDEFDRSGENPDGSWNYWRDPKMHYRLNMSEMGPLADREQPFYASQLWHITHCAFNWKKQYRAATTGVIIEHETDSVHHVSHCLDIWKMRIPLEKIATISGVGLNSDIRRHGESEGDGVAESY